MLHLLALPFLASFLLTILFTPIVIKLAKKFNFIDYPERNHPAILHKIPLPRAGGIPLYLSFIITALIFLPIRKYLVGIFLGGAINVIIGTLDDKYSLSPFLRLFFQILSALVIIISGIGITYLTNPLGGYIHLDKIAIPFFILGKKYHLLLWADLLTVLWLVFVMNMVNWSKGVGQLSALSTITALVLAGIALRFMWPHEAQVQTATLALIVAGAGLGFQPFNFPPEKIMPGFGASTFLGFMLSVLAILAGGKLAAVILVLTLPAVDMVISIFRRIRAGRLPFYGDRGHIYHRLLDLGWSKRKIILFYWILTSTLGFLAFSFNTQAKLLAIVIFAILSAMSFLVVNLSFAKKNKEQGPS